MLADEIRSSAFESSCTATLLLQAGGRIVAANPAARRLLAGESLLRIENGRLEAKSRENARQLAVVLAGASERTRIHVFPEKGVHSFSLIMAIRRMSDDPSSAILKLRPPVVPPLQRLGPVAKAYCLTEREARVLRLLISGKDVQEAADLMKVSVSTARTFVKHAYLKLGVRNRVQVISLVLAYWAFND